MENNHVEEEITSIIAEVSGFDTEEINLGNKLADDLEIDSIKAIEIVVAIEKKFQIKIRDEDVPAITTVKETVDLVHHMLNQKDHNNDKI